MLHEKQQPQAIIHRKRAVIYCRVSSDKQEQDGESLEYQEDKCSRYAELHDIDILMVLKEVKSGFIHYSLRDKLTLARQMVRDGFADCIIVWDLRRFSRNFVHSAMIFEEIESAGGEVISVSENIDNSLTGKLIRSIMAWSAESERNKIVEYANRRWQTRIELGLPVGTGKGRYGWDWGDEEKTFYVINPEEAAIRVAVFHMFVEEDMSMRAIMHKLTEDKIPIPRYSKKYQRESREKAEKSEKTEIKKEHTIWGVTAIRTILRDPENIGTLVICRERRGIGPDGRIKMEPHPCRKEVPGGIPAIINPDLYERAQEKLRTHKAELSHRPINPQNFLLRGHIFCSCCGRSMNPRTQKRREKQKWEDRYPFYRCLNRRNKYNACPSQNTIRTSPLDDIVWEECCVLFKRFDALRARLNQEMELAVKSMLEDTTGQEQINGMEATIEFAKNEQAKHAKGSYMYNLLEQDINRQEEQLARYREELRSSSTVAVISYQKKMADFLEFLDIMHGNYEKATFAQKRNALEMLGVRVVVHDAIDDTYGISEGAQGIMAEGQEWFSAKEAALILGVNKKTIHFYKRRGQYLRYKEEPHLLIHRDEILKLQEKGFKQRNTREIVRKRVEITYSLRIQKETAVGFCLQTRRYMNVSASRTPGTL